VITVCSVLCGNRMSGYMDVLCDNLVRHARLVSEIIFVVTDSEEEGVLNEWTHGHIQCKIYGYPFSFGFGKTRSTSWYHMVAGHAYGMQRAIELASNDLVWMMDPDQFLFMAVDKFYVEMMEEHQVDIIGISHFNPVDQSYGYFPCIINCMCRRSFLPPDTWLAKDLFIWSGMRKSDRCVPIQPAAGHYFAAGPIREYEDKFPNPNGIFDAGCNLWLWSEECQGRWMAFYLDCWLDCFKDNFGTKEIVYPMNYSQKHYKTNFGLEDSVGEQDLLYHRTRGGKENPNSFRELYYSLLYNHHESLTPTPSTKNIT
jgi:hypothetical protein